MNQASNICDAMRAAGIADPDSYEGKHFCWQKCPYPKFCVVFETDEENERETRKRERQRRVKVAKALRKLGMHRIEIAKRLGVHPNTAQQYLKGK